MIDDIGGWHPDPALRKWGVGSCFENEGQFLYRLVRELRPKVLVEIGRLEGCSTSHLALACKHNGLGKVYSIDIASGTGHKIPPDLLPWVELITADAMTCPVAPGNQPIDLLLEDGAHTTGFTSGILSRFHAATIIVHDYCHWDCQKTVKEEAEVVLGKPDEVFFEPPSDCGYGVWRK